MDWKEAQAEDEVISKLVTWLHRRKVRDLRQELRPLPATCKGQAFYDARKVFTLRNRILYYARNILGNPDTFLCFVVPTTYCRKALNRCYTDARYED